MTLWGSSTWNRGGMPCKKNPTNQVLIFQHAKLLDLRTFSIPPTDGVLLGKGVLETKSFIKESVLALYKQYLNGGF
jgi:hypothetical protein